MASRKGKGTMKNELEAPVARKKLAVHQRHGIPYEDLYAWMRVENWQEAMRDPSKLPAEIRTYLEAENAYTKAKTGPTEKLQKELFGEMRGRIKEDDSSVPTPDGKYEYYTRFRAGGQHPIFCRKMRGSKSYDSERILLDGDKKARGNKAFNIGACAHSTDHNWLAYAIDANGSECYSIHIRNLQTGAELKKEVIGNTTPNIVWANDSRTLYYTMLDEQHRPSKVFRHSLGTPVGNDELLYAEKDSGFFVGVGKTESDAFIIINAHDHQTSEVRVLDANDPNAKPRLIEPRKSEMEYSVHHHGDSFLIVTNDNAEDFKIVCAPLDAPERENWRDIIPHRSGTLIADMIVFNNFLVLLERENALPRIIVSRLNDAKKDAHSITFDEEAYALGVQEGFEFDTTTLRFSYSSPATPAQIFDYNMETRERTLRKEQEVPSGHNPEDYIVRRRYAESHDGERVPVTLLHHKDTPLDGTAPLWLCGYGSYGLTIPASFGIAPLSLADRGFLYAIAHIRGGKDCGERWYKDGKRMNKKNTFYDFIAAAEMFIREGYTRKGNTVAEGGSAGGMLMGTVANMRPELFAAIVAHVPFVDVLNTMCDASLPLTPLEWPEWGNPIEDSEACAYIASYSPYDNVRTQAYPNMLVTAGISDPRVTYWEPAKWVAKLRATKTDNNMLLLKTNMDAGHGGASGRFERLKERALAYAFGMMHARGVRSE